MVVLVPLVTGTGGVELTDRAIDSEYETPVTPEA
jgi:hypothetical protein